MRKPTKVAARIWLHFLDNELGRFDVAFMYGVRFYAKETVVDAILFHQSLTRADNRKGHP